MIVSEFFKDYGPHDAMYILMLLVVLVCLYRGHRAGYVNLWELVTATDKAGKTRTDARKFYECGAFVVATVAFSYLVIMGKLTEAYLAVYIGAFVTARIFRDREQRLNRMLDKPEVKP